MTFPGSCRCRSHSTPALPFTHICFPSPDSALLSLVKRSRGPCVFTALTAFSEAVTGGGGDNTCWSTHLVEPGAPHLLPEVIPRQALRNGPPPSALPHPGSSPSVGKNRSIPHGNHSRGRVPSRVPSSQHPRGRVAPLSPLVGGSRVCPSEGRSAPEPPSAQL